jgi:hypothetical protein
MPAMRGEGRCLMDADEHRCRPIFDADGTFLARVRVSPGMCAEGLAALAELVRAAQRQMAEEAAANPKAAAERARRQARMRERVARWRGEEQ